MAISDDGTPVSKIPQEVAKRALAIIAVVDKAHNEKPAKLEHWVSTNKIDAYFTVVEALFFKNAAPSQQEIVTQSWRAECLVPLFWALGLVEELPPLNILISWENITGLKSIIDKPDEFIRNASLRPKDVLEEAEANLYHQHWRVRDAELFGKPMPEELIPRIVYERRYAASWLVGWGDDWDNVPTDT